MRAQLTRRAFLKATATTAAGLAVAQPAFSGHEEKKGPRCRPRGQKKETIVLDKPHIVTPDSSYLNSCGEIANKRFVLDANAIGPRGVPTGTAGIAPGTNTVLTALGLLTLPPGSENIRIVDCEFESPWRSVGAIPDLKPGNPKHLKGIQIYYSSNICIEGCDFDYIPSSAIYFHGCEGIEIEDVWSRNCRQLVFAQWWGTRRNRHIRLNRLHHADGWAGADLDSDPDYASVYAAGRAVGWNAVSGVYADTEISNLTTSGEVKAALKIMLPVRVNLDRIYTSHLMIQGTISFNLTNDPANGNGSLGAYNLPGFDESLGNHAMDVTVTRSRFRPGQNAWFPGLAANVNQLSFHQERIKFRDCVIYKPIGPRNQAIQAWDGVDLDVRDCLFVGYDKPSDPLPPYSASQTILRIGDYGKPGSLPSKINEDFVRVNKFRKEPAA